MLLINGYVAGNQLQVMVWVYVDESDSETWHINIIVI